MEELERSARVDCLLQVAMALFGIQCLYVTEDRAKEWKTTNTARKFKAVVPPARFVFELCQTLVSCCALLNCNFFFLF